MSKPQTFRLTDSQQAALGAAYLFPRTTAIFVIVKWFFKMGFYTIAAGVLFHMCTSEQAAEEAAAKHPKHVATQAAPVRQGMIDSCGHYHPYGEPLDVCPKPSAQPTTKADEPEFGPNGEYHPK